MIEDKDVSTNEYGIPDAEYAAERKAARDAASGVEVAEVETETPEIKPTEDKPRSAETQKEAVVVEPAADDPFASLPEDVRAKVQERLQAAQSESEKYKKKYDSDIGRINAYQTKYEEASRKSAALEQQLAALNKPAPKTLRESATSPLLMSASEADPALVDTLDELRSTIRQEFQQEFDSKLQAVVAPLYESRHQEAQSQFTRELDSSYSNWREVVYAKDDDGRIRTDQNGTPVFSEAWAHYVSDQPPSIANAIVNVANPSEAIWAIENYAQWAQKQGHATADVEQEAAAAPQIPNADAIQNKRQNDLKRGTPPTSHQVPLTTVEVDKPDDERWVAKMRKLARESLDKNDPSIFTNAR